MDEKCEHWWVYYTYDRIGKYIAYERCCKNCGVWEGYYG